MLDNKKLQLIRDKILGVTSANLGDLNSTVYLQQIRDAILGVSPAQVQGNLHEKIYLQQIRNAKLGIPDGQFGSLPDSIYLQQIINAYNGVADGVFGNLSESDYLNLWYSVATGATPWYQTIALGDIAAAYAPKGASSLAASYINLAHPGVNDANPIVAPTFNSASGWIFNGTTQWLKTVADAANLSVFCRFSNLGGPLTSAIWGCVTNTSFFIFVPNSGAGQIAYWSENSRAGSATPSSGVAGISGTKGFLNGAVDAILLTSPHTPKGASTIAAGGVDNEGVLAFPKACRIQALWIATRVLTDPEAASISANMAAL